MTRKLQPHVRDYLVDLLLESAAPAVLSFDANWALTAVSGNVDQYTGGSDSPFGLVELVRNMFAALDCSTRQVFPSVELPNGSMAHMHLVPDPPVHHVVLIDASAEMHREQAVQQRGNEARLASEQTMRMGEARFRTVVSAMAEGVIVRDRAGNVLASNEAASRILGLPAAVLSFRRLDQLVWQFIREDGSPFTNESHPVAAALRTGVPQSNVIMGVRRLDDSLRWLSVNAAPLTQDGDELPYAVVTTFHDITERKEAERALRESEARFRGILNATPDGVLVSDANGRIVLVNPSAERLFNYEPGELIGKYQDLLVPVSAQAEYRELWQAYLKNPTIHAIGHRGNFLARRKDGSEFNVEAVLSPLVLDEKIHAITVVRDVTERCQLEAQLRQSQKMEAVGQLTSGVAHDFNNILGVIIGNLDLLERALADNESALKRVQTAQRAVMRGSDLTRRLLAFSRRQQLSPEAISVRDTIENVLQMADRTLGPEIKIKTHFEEGLRPVLADSGGLENALLNLAINSRDAMPEGGMLTVTAGEIILDESYRAVVSGDIKPGSYACLTVSDTGKGMPPEVLDRAIDPFFTTKGAGRGTGLGLSMVYGFVKQTGGHVSMYSEVGHGTTIRLFLPFAPGVRTVAAVPTPIKHPVKQEGTVLVVDDEVDLLEVAVAYLDEMGFRVLWANDGVTALRVVEREPRIDLLLTDVVMPGGMSGVELACKARAGNAALKVIYSTGFSSKALSQRTDMIIEGKVLSKPYRRDEFVAVVQEVMGNTSIE